MRESDVVKVKDDGIWRYGEIAGVSCEGELLEIIFFPNEANAKWTMANPRMVEVVELLLRQRFAIEMVIKSYHNVNLLYAELGSSQTDMVYQALRTAVEKTIKEIIEGK